MKDKKCQHKDCCSYAECYISEKELYACAHHCRMQYPNYKAIPLVDSSIVKGMIEVLEQCCKEFVAFTLNHNNERVFAKYEALASQVNAELDDLDKKLKEELETDHHFALEPFLLKAKEIWSLLLSNPLYKDFLIDRAWVNWLNTAQSKDTKSGQSVEMELKSVHEVQIYLKINLNKNKNYEQVLFLQQKTYKNYLLLHPKSSVSLYVWLLSSELASLSLLFSYKNSYKN